MKVDKHLASWAGVCPGKKQSGGKRLSGKTTKGNPYLRAVLGEVAWAISHTRDNYLAAQFHRIARRRGKQKAVVAVSHSVLVILYHMLSSGASLHRSGSRLLRETGGHPHRALSCAATRAAWLYRHLDPGASGLREGTYLHFRKKRFRHADEAQPLRA